MRKASTMRKNVDAFFNSEKEKYFFNNEKEKYFFNSEKTGNP
jgi:hypothetical protein